MRARDVGQARQNYSAAVARGSQKTIGGRDTAGHQAGVVRSRQIGLAKSVNGIGAAAHGFAGKAGGGQVARGHFFGNQLGIKRRADDDSKTLHGSRHSGKCLVAPLAHHIRHGLRRTDVGQSECHGFALVAAPAEGERIFGIAQKCFVTQTHARLGQDLIGDDAAGWAGLDALAGASLLLVTCGQP